MEKNANLEEIERIQAQLKVLPIDAGPICKEDLEEIFKDG